MVIGGSGSGKTTMVYTSFKSIADLTLGDSLVNIEDTSELQSHSENTIILRSSDHTSIDTLIRATMMFRPAADTCR
ncbi:Conjugal transfer protein trbB (fragment) [Maridesulfovibrio hydrothermalis AM13 = DSM 14728]|uniref:Conjugal transfer protein trbB n=1 Tax=Maridesulfovibrio hydrothermalis AM13 = DSM 14728 TaxID=1121451 RepID=L0R9L9_9BACT